MPSITPTRSLSSSGPSSRAKQANSATARTSAGQYQTRCWVDLDLVDTDLETVDLGDQRLESTHRREHLALAPQSGIGFQVARPDQPTGCPDGVGPELRQLVEAATFRIC